MKKLEKDNGITLISLVMYIILTIIVISALTIISSNFRNNIGNMNTETMQETEFDKLNLQMLKETKTDNNVIEKNETDSTKLVFSNENTYTYNENDKAIYLNDNIKIADHIENCLFNVEEINDKQKLTITVNINGNTKVMEYILSP